MNYAMPVMERGGQGMFTCHLCGYTCNFDPDSWQPHRDHACPPVLAELRAENEALRAAAQEVTAADLKWFHGHDKDHGGDVRGAIKRLTAALTLKTSPVLSPEEQRQRWDKDIEDLTGWPTNSTNQKPSSKE